MRHDLKCWPEPWLALRHETKRHEFRKDDRGFNVGDTLLLREWNPETGDYSGDELIAEVTYLSRGPEWGIPAGYVVMSVRLVSIGWGSRLES